MSFVKLLEHDGDLTVVYELKDKPLVDKFVSKYNWPRPIPVSERLPERDEEVMAFFQGGWWCVNILEYAKDNKHWFETTPNDGEPWMTLEDDATHWLPLPPPPEGAA
jgi:hypothetical protein